ncbi:metal ABC transporter ATP-binding protein [Solicola sp. PLA-1-18]|uniref:metal ABC transporter ATP-binding protein n=1 Tax=Solicola sp. PLA-1-18 TaxID=3380532 RepID=UPI003B7D9333
MTATAAPPVQLTDVTVQLGGRPVVQGVDLTVDAGEFVALLGTNGSGKSTLMRAAVGLLPLAGGSARLFGAPVDRFREWARLGYVPQRSTAVSGVPSTVGEVALSGTLSRRRVVGLPRRADRRAAMEALERVGLVDRARDAVTELSGGQQQRVMIARALAGRCDLLVMDEPTAGVDQESQVVLADLFRGLVGEGRSVWLVAHELGPLAALVDRAVVLRDGRVVHDGAYTPVFGEPHAHDHPHGEEPVRPTGVAPHGAWGSTG